MKQFYLKSFMLLFVTFVGLAVFAYNCQVDGIYYNLDYSNHTASVTNGSKIYMGAVVIPNSFNYNGTTYNVASIGRSAFSRCESLTSIIIPNSVTSIGNSAFYNCSGLTSITIPNSVTSIGDNAFAFCSSLTSIIIPESVTSIGDEAFFYCIGLTNITMPKSVTSLGTGVLAGCIQLSDIAVESDNSVYDSRDNCNAIIQTNNNTLIAGCKTTVIPSSVTGIGNYAFAYCENLSDIVIGDNITSIGPYAFSGCIELRNVTIPNSVISIGDCAFRRCSNLRNVVIGENVKTIGIEAFRLCDQMHSMTIPDNVTSIGYSVFPDRCYIYVNKDCITLFALLNAKENWKFICDAETGGSLPILKKTPTTIKFAKIGGNVEQYSIYVNGTELDKSTMEMTGMIPGKTVEIQINVSDKDNVHFEIKGSFSWPRLTLTTNQPKVTKAGEAIVCATTNMDEAETHAGFEWRKIDAPDLVESKQGEAVIYNGTMEGKIKNLDPSTYWKVRAYYRSNSGNMYYGDWVGFDPSDFSYFEPTVHTYGSPTVDGNSATLTGMVVEGTDEILEQGFEYWKNSTNARELSRAPSDVQRVIADKGQRMTVTLAGLSPSTTYSYQAYVTTAKGTFYGQELSFDIPSDGSAPSAISILQLPPLASSNVYTLQGMIIRSGTTSVSGLPRGVYIVNGRKVFVK